LVMLCYREPRGFVAEQRVPMSNQQLRSVVFRKGFTKPRQGRIHCRAQGRM